MNVFVCAPGVWFKSVMNLSCSLGLWSGSRKSHGRDGGGDLCLRSYARPRGLYCDVSVEKELFISVEIYAAACGQPDDLFLKVLE